MASTLVSFGLVAALSSLAVQAVPTQPCPRDAPFDHQGCFVSNVNGQKILSAASYADDAMTVGSCATFCTGKNFKYFGIEYGRECYCGETLPAGSAVATSECSFSCPGGGTQTCGAGDRMDLYQNNFYVASAPASLDVPYLGCFVDSGERILPHNLLGADDMTAEKCAAHCAGFAYFGVEFGRECFCGDVAPTHQAPEPECSFPCAGDATQICGAEERINVWGPSPSSTTSSTLPSATPVAPGTVGSFEYKGCYTDRGDNHSLTGRVEYLPDMTHEKCAAFCDRYSYPFFGVEYGSQCFCGVRIEDVAELRPIEECAMTCGGDHGQKCGDSNRLGIFGKPESSSQPVNPPTAGLYIYKSCWTDKVDQRSLAGPDYRSPDMTVESCAAFCGEQSFEYFGVEYADECYCGNDLGGSAAPEGDCTQLCAGNSAQWCGGPDRLNIYT
ncbi:putative fungistatic metabolite, partial [Triangularia setosa]